MSIISSHAYEKRVFRAFTASDGLADNSAQTIKCTRTGRMTISTLGNINFYDGAKFSYISTAQQTKYRLSDYSGFYRLYYDKFHHLWLKNTNEVTCVNLTTETFVNNVDSLFTLAGFKGGEVLDMFVDGGGDVWLCGKGFIQSAELKKRFPTHTSIDLQDVERYGEHDLLLFYGDGSVSCYDVKTAKKKYTTRAYSAETAHKYDMNSTLIASGRGFFQIRNGEAGAILLYFNAVERSWNTIMETELHLNSMALYDDVLYIASQKGYFSYQVNTGELNHEQVLTLRDGRLLETEINALEFDRQGGMWVGTQMRGLLYARPLDAPFQQISLASPEGASYREMLADRQGIDEFNGKDANVMFIDSRRWTWVGTSTGLYLYTSPQAEPQLLTRQAGLLNNVIHSIIEDNFHNIWVSSSYGITCMQIEGDAIKYVTSFNDDDNVPNETFIDGKVMKLGDGSIIMQTIDHIVRFNPDDFRHLFSQEPLQMFPKLTSIMVNGAFVSVGTEINGSVILDKAITRTKEINLNYDQNTVALTFSALNFARPLQTFYRVRVRELDDEWKIYSFYNSSGLVDRRGLLHMPLVGLRPGTYHIEVQASNVIDKWVGSPYEWVVNVHEPWWRASGMLMFLGGVLMVLLFANFMLYNRNTRLRVKRNSDEGDMVGRILNYADRCEAFESEIIGRECQEQELSDNDQQSELTKEFIDIMVIVLPYIKEQNGKFTIRELVDLTGTDVSTFYKVVSSSLYKNPRALVRVLRLMQVQELLRTTNKPLEDIVEQCHFASPNYMIATFYHQFKMTPRDYRLSI